MALKEWGKLFLLWVIVGTPFVVLMGITGVHIVSVILLVIAALGFQYYFFYRKKQN